MDRKTQQQETSSVKYHYGQVEVYTMDRKTQQQETSSEKYQYGRITYVHRSEHTQASRLRRRTPGSSYNDDES